MEGTVQPSPWAGRFNDREARHIEFCRTYAGQFAHGAPGHIDFMLIAILAGMLEEQQLSDEVREALAAYAHEAWSGWMAYFLGKCSRDGDPQAGHESDLIIPGGYVQALQALIDTPYAALSKEQKDNDRAEADKMIAIVRGL